MAILKAYYSCIKKMVKEQKGDNKSVEALRTELKNYSKTTSFLLNFSIISYAKITGK